jgi:acyl-CoA hydrolase
MNITHTGNSIMSEAAAVTRLIDMVFPNDANHHGTLFGGTAMAHMDKVAFLAASRHGRRAFVTAACDRLDFTASALIGEMVEATGVVVRVGRTSLSVAVELHAEALLTGERRLCTRGVFHMVAMKGDGVVTPLPPLATEVEVAREDDDGRDGLPLAHQSLWRAVRGRRPAPDG